MDDPTTDGRGSDRARPTQPTGNYLLDAMAADERDRLMPSMERVRLPLRTVLEEEDVAPEHGYFLVSGIASRIAVAADARVETGVVGREGMTGLPIVLGTQKSPQRFFIQVTAEALRIDATALADAFESLPSLRAVLYKHIHVTGVQVSQTALANARNTIEERLARWLLMCFDRLDTPLIPITHEFLSLMLGVHRPGVTLALHTLEGAGMVRAERGQVTVSDRAALIDVAGDAYGVAEREGKRLFGC